MRELIKSAEEKLSVWLWPEVCPFCGRVSRRGICTECRIKTDVLRIREPRCMQCGKPIRRAEQECCYDCKQTHHRYDRGYGMWLHREPVSTSVYQFKYHNQRVYGNIFAEEFVRYYGQIIRSWRPDLIMPVPLHKRRRRKRGYNQAEIISRELGRRLRIPVDAASLVRRIYTDPQKELNPQDRRKNLEHVFELRQGFRPVQTVLLVDDIYTTGSTIDAVSRVLKENGVEKVYFLTISIGQGY